MESSVLKPGCLEWYESNARKNLLEGGAELCKKEGIIRDYAVIEKDNKYALVTNIDKTMFGVRLIETYSNSGLVAYSYYQDFDRPSKEHPVMNLPIKRTPEAVRAFFADSIDMYRKIKDYNLSFLIQ